MKYFGNFFTASMLVFILFTFFETKMSMDSYLIFFFGMWISLNQSDISDQIKNKG